MSVAKLIDFFSVFSVLPVEISDVRDQIVEAYGVQDEIRIVPFTGDPNRLRGLFLRFRERTGPYSTKNCCIVLYNKHMSLAWQRLIACKELIHVLDSAMVRTASASDVLRLSEIILSKRQDEQGGSVVQMAAATDQFALYYALAVLCPSEAIEDYSADFHSGKILPEQIADTFSIPLEFVSLIMGADWPSWVEFFKKFSGLTTPIGGRSSAAE